MQRWGNRTYSQNGQDLFLMNLCETLKISKPSFIDVGAHHAFQISNTALLVEKLGARGVNIEANPMLAQNFEEDRPNDVTLNFGVGPVAGDMNFYMWDASSPINTFSQAEAQKWIDSGHHTTVIKVPVVTLSWIVEKYCGNVWPDLLLMDAERLDFSILQSTTFNEGPKIIIAEVAEDEGTVEMMVTKGYVPVIRLISDLVFIRQDLQYKIKI
jgi:FkbM family methyltransferase